MLIDGVFKTLDPLLKGGLAQSDRDPQAYYEKLEGAEVSIISGATCGLLMPKAVAF